MNTQTLLIQKEQEGICAVYGCVNQGVKVITQGYENNKTQEVMFETKTLTCKIHADIISETEITRTKITSLS